MIYRHRNTFEKRELNIQYLNYSDIPFEKSQFNIQYLTHMTKGQYYTALYYKSNKRHHNQLCTGFIKNKGASNEWLHINCNQR